MFAGITNALYGFLEWIHGWFGGAIGTWGITIILFTIIVRAVLTPLDIKSRASMRKTQKLQPQLVALQKKYANDKEKLNQKTAELYKKAHVNPLSSCLPLLLTWPILIAVFGAMRTAANAAMLRQVTEILNGQQPTMEPFIWIKNLWMPDNPTYSALPTFDTLRMVSANEWLTWFKDLQSSEAGLPALLQSLNLTEASFDNNQLAATVQAIVDAMGQAKNAAGETFYLNMIGNIPGATIPLVGWSIKTEFNGFLALPILSAVSQITMTKIMGGSQQPTPEGQPNTGKFMQWFFPLFSLWICIGYSAAFALYWVAGNLVSMGQTFAINKYLDRKEKMAAPLAGEGSVK